MCTVPFNLVNTHISRYIYNICPPQVKNITVTFPEYRSRIHERTISLEISGRNLESSQTLGFRIQHLHNKPVSYHSYSGGGGVGVNTLVVVNRIEETYYFHEFGLSSSFW
jgi:hypothetical protein